MEALEDKIRRFLAVCSGYGYGYGYGSGDGYGSSDGSGYGEGSGSGSGDGYGYGSSDGSGYGEGSGSGSGSGYGYGYGYGSGSGDGSGDGIKTFCGKKVYRIDDVPTLIYQVKATYARGAILQDDLTLKPCFIARHGNCFAHGDTLHEAERDAIAKWMENRPLEERIADFVKTHPLSDAKGECRYGFDDLFNWHHILTGSCEFGRRQFCEQHGLSKGDTFTIREFIDLTKDAYGSDAIRQLSLAYKDYDERR